MTAPAYKGIRVLREYFQDLHAKGLITLCHANTLYRYTTHWGAQRDVIAPELTRLRVQYGVRFRISCFTQDNSGTWQEASTIEEDDTYINVDVGPYWTHC